MDELIKRYLEEYLNKLEIGYRLPAEVTLEDFWQKLLEARRKKQEFVPLADQAGEKFWYLMTHALQKNLHEIDSHGRDTLYSMVKQEIEGELIKESLIEEAFYSSVIEGAFSTLKKAKELINKNARPKDNSEQMILNNFYAMRFILENKDKDLSNELICDLHKTVTKGTLEDPNYEGRYRDDMVYITNNQGEAIYTPPPADKLMPAINELIKWINTAQGESFIHPIIKAAILHFYLVYLHPFFDGNGRTARALFYFYLIKHQYDFFRYFSISSIINASRSGYYKAIKDVEDYESDLTYFLLYMSEAILKAIEEIKEKISQHYRKDYYLAKLKEKGLTLNERQGKFLNKFMLWKNKEITIQKYREMHKVVYQTARADLLSLEQKGILFKQKRGKKFTFTLNLSF